MNKVILTGRLTKDVVITTGKDSQGAEVTIAKGSIAVSRGKEADFVNFTAFGATAKFIEKWLSTKGSKIEVSGSIRTGNYKKTVGGEDITIYTTEVIVSDVGFPPSDKKDDNGESAPNNAPSNSNSAAPTNSAPETEFGDWNSDVDEELPFN